MTQPRRLDDVLYRILPPNIDDVELTPTEPQWGNSFDLNRVLLTGLDQSGVTGYGEISESALRKVNLSRARLDPLTLTNTSLSEVDISAASLPTTTARRVSFTQCRATGVGLFFAHANDVTFRSCQLTMATIGIERVKGWLIFEDCVLREAWFKGDLSRVVFLNCDLTQAEFTARNAAQCDLRGSKLDEVKGLNTLRGAMITTDQALTVATQLATEAGLYVKDAE